MEDYLGERESRDRPVINSIFAGFAADNNEDYGSTSSTGRAPPLQPPSFPEPLSSAPSLLAGKRSVSSSALFKGTPGTARSVNWRLPEDAPPPISVPRHTALEIVGSSGRGTRSSGRPNRHRGGGSGASTTTTRVFANAAAGAISFMTCCVVIICFAASVCASSPRLRPYQACLIQMIATGTVLGGVLGGLLSKLPLSVPSPDLFVCPFFACVASTLEGAIPDGSAVGASDGAADLFVTFAAVSMAMVATEGVLLCASSRLQLLRVGDYTPFPVTMGLVAGTGLSMARSGVLLLLAPRTSTVDAGNGDGYDENYFSGNPIGSSSGGGGGGSGGSSSSSSTSTSTSGVILELFSWVWIAAAAATAAVLLLLERRCGLKPGAAFLPVFLLATALFYGILVFVGSGGFGDVDGNGGGGGGGGGSEDWLFQGATTGVAWGVQRGAFFGAADLDTSGFFVWRSSGAFDDEGHLATTSGAGGVGGGGVQGLLWSGGRVRWDAALQCSGCVFTYVVLNLLRVTLQLAATLQTMEVDKRELGEEGQALELLALGSSHLAGGLVGSFGSVPFLAVMATLKSMNDDMAIGSGSSSSSSSSSSSRKGSSGSGGGGGGGVYGGPLHHSAPGVVCTALVALLTLTSFRLLLVVPKFIFTALMFHTSAKLMHSSLVQALPTLDWGESGVLVVILAVSFDNAMTGLGLGAAASVLLFVYAWMDAGCIKYESSGILWRSSVERPEVDVDWLERHGDTIQILQLQGFIFFGNARQVLDRVDAILRVDDMLQARAQAGSGSNNSGGGGGGGSGTGDEDTDDTDTSNIYDAGSSIGSNNGDVFAGLLGAAPPSAGTLRSGSDAAALSSASSSGSLPRQRRQLVDDFEPAEPIKYVILDLTLVMGLDHTALVALEETLAAAKKRSVTVVVCGVSSDIMARIRRSQLELLNRPLVGERPLGTGGGGGGGGVERGRDDENVKFCDDLDASLSWCEDELMRGLGSTTDRSASFRDADLSDEFDYDQDEFGRGNVRDSAGASGGASGATPSLANLSSLFSMPPGSPEKLLSAIASAASPQQAQQQRQRGQRPPTGFQRWLHLAAKRHHFAGEATAELEMLEQFMERRSWRRGSVIMSEQHGTPIATYRSSTSTSTSTSSEGRGGFETDGDHQAYDSAGLSFIVAGLISKKRDPQQSINTRSRLRLFKMSTNTWLSSSSSSLRLGSKGKLGGYAGREALHANMREFQFARFGPGWCIGLEDAFTGYRSVGKFEAETDCVVYFLSFQEVERLKESHPKVIMHLFLLLGRLMSSQFNRTKERLSHVVDAMSTKNTRKSNKGFSRRNQRLAAALAGGL